jgi:hypothetical protein
LLGLEKLLQSGVNKVNVKISNSWDGITAWTGIRPETIKASKEEYNIWNRRPYGNG